MPYKGFRKFALEITCYKYSTKTKAGDQSSFSLYGALAPPSGPQWMLPLKKSTGLPTS
jgi:hypothetical protein